MITFLNILSLALSVVAFTMSLILYFKVMRLEGVIDTQKKPEDRQSEVDDEQKKKEDELLRL
jgi:hypothetical protein